VLTIILGLWGDRQAEHHHNGKGKQWSDKSNRFHWNLRAGVRQIGLYGRSTLSPLAAERIGEFHRKAVFHQLERIGCS